MKLVVQKASLRCQAVTLEHSAAGWAIMNIHLNLIAGLPKITQSDICAIAAKAAAEHRGANEE